jgi:hypothetical protein
VFAKVLSMYDDLGWPERRHIHLRMIPQDYMRDTVVQGPYHVPVVSPIVGLHTFHSPIVCDVSTQKSANPSNFVSTGVRIKFASFHSDGRNAQSEATGVTTSFQVSEAPSDASDGTAREPKSATRNAFRESDAV